MILWFRNDLRLHDNPAFLHALNHGCKEAVFLSTPEQWQQHDVAPIKVDFIHRHVNSLKEQLASFGIKLVHHEVADFNSQIKWLTEYCQNHSHTEIVANSEVELNEVQRDQKLQQIINLTLFEADVIVPKGQVLNKSGDMYKVFTPFKNAWLTYVKTHSFQYIDKTQISAFSNPTLMGSKASIDVSADIEHDVEISHDNSSSHVVESSSRWPLVSTIEENVIPNFLNNKLQQYEEHRDIPSIKGTSGLSPYLSIGAISPRYLLRLLLERYPDILSKSPEAEFVWLNELIWREFYRHLLFHFPNLCQHKNFNAKYNNLPWPNNPKYIQAWQQGKTGYPIVDAAMRQLNQTGWMHNRLRMIVGSFLTKHLLIDWRIGEKYFMSKLIDGDLAANNGGWQWCAGTGCDAQPYFRVFNPITQSERFDASGQFIRKYVPELEDVPDKFIHFPHDYLAKQANNSNNYIAAIVEHKAARLRALDFYKSGL